MQVEIQMHPQGSPSCLSHRVISRAATLSPNLPIPTITKHPRLFPLPGWVSILAWLQPGGRSQCCLGLPPVLPHPQHLVMGWQDSSGMHRVPREMKVIPVLAPEAHVLFS